MSEQPVSPSSGGLSFRSARAADLPAIIAMLADDELGQQREDTSLAGAATYERAFAAIDADPNNEVIVADSGGAVVGCLQLSMIPGLSHKGGTRAQIEGVRVASTQRGQAIGAKMIKHAIDLARARGAFLLQLTSTTTRLDARRFYEGLGFEATHIGFKMRL